MWAATLTCRHSVSIHQLSGLCPDPLTQYWSLHSQNCCFFQMHLKKCSVGPLMCVSLSECLVPDGWLREWRGGRRRDAEIFPCISRVLVPLADTLPLCSSLPECIVCTCVSPVQSCGCRGRQRDWFSLCWSGQWRKWRLDSICYWTAVHFPLAALLHLNLHT